MKSADIIAELKTFYKEGVAYVDLDRRLREEDVQRWCMACGWSRPHLFDEIAWSLAVGYNTSELSFEFCDMVANDLCGPVTDTSPPGPELFWDVYSAFDEGEYFHGNNRDEDPVETYTRPMIARIVEAIERSSIVQPPAQTGNAKETSRR